MLYMTIIEITHLLDNEWQLKNNLPKNLHFNQHYVLTLMIRPYISNMPSHKTHKYFSQYLIDHLDKIKKSMSSNKELKMSMYYCISSRDEQTALSIISLLKLSLNRSIFRFSAIMRNKKLFTYMIRQNYPRFIKGDNDVYFILNDAINVSIKESVFMGLIRNIKKCRPRFEISMLTFLKITKNGYVRAARSIAKHINKKIWTGKDVNAEIQNIDEYPAKSINYLNEFFQSRAVT